MAAEVASGPAVTTAAAFFDVDETLITVKSMFEFLRFWLARTGDDGQAYARAAAALQEQSAAGAPREAVNRAYYRLYAGTALADLMAAGRDWYAAYRERDDAYVAAGVSALRAHRAAGDAVVLVSGSFLPCLAPVADDLGVTRVLCTQVTVAPLGTLTGAVEAPMIGRAKADAVRATIAGLGLSAAACWAYGDHASDLEMLRAVGHPSVVGDDPVLIGQAREHGWPVLERADYERGRT